MRTDYSLGGGKKSGGSRARKPIEIMLTPMIDVIFLLLVFFLVSSTLIEPELLLPSGVSELSPNAGTTDQPPPEPTDDQLEQVVVKVESGAGEPSITVNGDLIGSPQELSDRFVAIGRVKADVPIVIDPAGDTRASIVVAIYDSARGAGLSRVYLATRPSK